MWTRLSKIADVALTITTLAIVILVVLAVSAAGYTIWKPANGSGDDAVAVVDLKTRVGGRTIGSPTAPLTIIEFTDFECPFCARYHQETFPIILQELVDRGVASYEVRHMRLSQIHPHAVEAAKAAECSGERFWEMADLLFERQQELETTNLLEYARGLGIASAGFDRCLKHEVPVRVQQNIEEAKRLSVKATPTFFVGKPVGGGSIRLLRMISGARSFETFQLIVRELGGTVARVQ